MSSFVPTSVEAPAAAPPSISRRDSAIYSLVEGRYSDGISLCAAELYSAADGETWLGDIIVAAMELDDLTLAANLAGLLAEKRFRSKWWPQATPAETIPDLDVNLSLPKLRHDAAQLRFLRRAGLLDQSFDPIIETFTNTADQLSSLGNNGRVALTGDYPAALRDVYGRIVRVTPAMRLTRALSDSWSRDEVQRQYREARPGVVVVDNFLTEEALASIRRFCTESTIWLRNRYADGRLGSLFFGGFNCPLLLQIAEDLRRQLPELIGSRHPLRQLWGFKNTCPLPVNSAIHADFAAVNVNFWITPDSANLNESSGGLVVYDLEAPISWDFEMYNERPDIIRELLASQKPDVFRIPYRHNRAIIFDSDLFHATEAVNFSPEYENHRINITLLYGDRANDHLYPPGNPPSVSAALRTRL